MHVLSTLLRVMLILILILNGVGDVYASAGMQLKTTQSHSLTSANKQPAVTPPCPDHHGAMAVEPQTTEREQPASPPLSGDQHGSPDCCDPSHCKCPCMHACAALPVLAVRMPVPLGNDVGVRRLSLGHPAPVLPHLIRPPIG
jgi:hypothetical protein